MPIPLPNLDDRTFDDLTAEARSLIPVLHPAWTDHNPGDPGIVLVELLAWLTEMLIFQVNQIPEANVRRFLALLGTPPSDDPLEAAVAATMRDLGERYRAVTPDDFEYLIRQTWPQTPEATGHPEVQRVRCVPGRDLTAADPGEPAPAHVSVIVVPEPGSPADTRPAPSAELTAALREFLDPRRMLTTQVHVLGPAYVDVGISANLALREDAPPADALDEALDRLAAFLNPLTWPFGQSVYPSEVYAVLEGSSLIDYVEDVQVTGPELADHQLARLARVDLTAYDGYGRTYPLTWEAS
jgi:Baseplate J-like protein